MTTVEVSESGSADVAPHLNFGVSARDRGVREYTLTVNLEGAPEHRCTACKGEPCWLSGYEPTRVRDLQRRSFACSGASRLPTAEGAVHSERGYVEATCQINLQERFEDG